MSPPAENLSIPNAHRIVSSISSGSVTPTTQIPKKNTSALKRCVSSISCDNSLECAKEHKHFKVKSTSNHERLTLLHNARILQRDGSLLHGSLTVDQTSGRIVEICLDSNGHETHEENLTIDQSKVQVIDCKNHIISPGFIDIQLNGAYGIDFSNADESSEGLKVDDMFEVAHKLLTTGCTSFCPTMVSSSPETYRRIIPLMKEARNQQFMKKSTNERRGANILGIHLEGPFFAPSKCGAHDNTYISTPSKGMASIDEIYGLNTSPDSDNATSGSYLENIDIITMAPELDGALDAIKSLTAPKESDGHSVVVSCGHTEATYEDGIDAITKGATMLTHVYNAMNPFHHREPGLVGLLSSEVKLSRTGVARPFYSMIVDGIHVHEAAISMAYNSHPQGEYTHSFVVFQFFYHDDLYSSLILYSFGFRLCSRHRCHGRNGSWRWYSHIRQYVSPYSR